MHWGKERGSMNERAWERERERVKTAGAVQVSKLQSSACNQRSGKGSLQECKPSPGIRLCSWHRLPVTSLSPGARDTLLPARGTPTGPLMPPMPQHRGVLLPEHTRTCLCVHAQIQTHSRSHIDPGAIPWEGGMHLCPRCGSSPGWGGPGEPHCSPSPVSPSDPAVFPNIAVSTCTQPRAHSPGKTNGFAPHLCPLISQTSLGAQMRVHRFIPVLGFHHSPPSSRVLSPSPASPLLQSQRVLRIWRHSLPGGEGEFQSRMGRTGSGCLGSTWNTIFSLALVGLRGISGEKQSPFHGD